MYTYSQVHLTVYQEPGFSTIYLSILWVLNLLSQL